MYSIIFFWSFLNTGVEGAGNQRHETIPGPCPLPHQIEQLCFPNEWKTLNNYPEEEKNPGAEKPSGNYKAADGTLESINYSCLSHAYLLLLATNEKREKEGAP